MRRPHIHLFHTVHLFGHRPAGISSLGLHWFSERVLQRCRCGAEREKTRRIWTDEGTAHAFYQRAR